LFEGHLRKALWVFSVQLHVSPSAFVFLAVSSIAGLALKGQNDYYRTGIVGCSLESYGSG
jgi:hypothetical protein